MSTAPGRRIAPVGVLVAAVGLVAVNLRPGATAVGPVLAEIRAGLDMSSSAAGLLTALPPLCFGLVGAVAVALARRVGTTAGVALGVLAAAGGLILRATTGSTVLFTALTVVALGGMALGNILVPAWVKHHGGRAEVPLMTVYGSGLVLGGALGSLATAPLADAGGGWRFGLGAWGVAMLVALPWWGWLAARERADADDRAAPMVRPEGRIAASSTARWLTALFGLQSLHAYVQFGWLPQIFRDAGLSPTYAGALAALLSGVGIVGGLTMPSIAARSRSLAPYLLGFAVLQAAGYVGLLAAPTTLPWLWALLLGVAGFAFPLAIALLTARTRHPAVTARLSGFVQPVGYLVAASGPLAVGIVHQAAGGWSLVLWLLLVTCVPFAWAGLRVARPGFVDDELG